MMSTCVFAVRLTEDLDWWLLLYPADLSVFLGFVLEGHPLPRQLPLQEVQQQITQGLEVVLSSLLEPQMGSYAGVAGCPHEWLSLPPGDVVAGPRLQIFFSQTEIYNVNGSFLVFFSDNEVVGLDVPMQEPLFLDGLETVNYLDSDIEDGGKSKLFLTKWPSNYWSWNKSSSELPNKSMIMNSLLSEVPNTVPS